MFDVTGKKSRKKFSKSQELDENETQQSITTGTNFKRSYEEIYNFK